MSSENLTLGRRPVGSCAADGSHRWAERRLSDDRTLITVFNGWLIESETKTTDARIANVLWDHLAERIEMSELETRIADRDRAGLMLAEDLNGCQPLADWKFDYGNTGGGVMCVVGEATFDGVEYRITIGDASGDLGFDLSDEHFNVIDDGGDFEPRLDWSSPSSMMFEVIAARLRVAVDAMSPACQDCGQRPAAKTTAGRPVRFCNRCLLDRNAAHRRNTAEARFDELTSGGAR